MPLSTDFVVQSYATFNYCQKSREEDTSRDGQIRPVALDHESDADPISLNGRIGHFGVGAQNSAFFIAGEELVITKHRSEGRVRELLISEDILQEQYRQDEQQTYRKEVLLRNPCDSCSAMLTRSDEPHPVLRELLDAEIGRPSFTLLVLSHIKEPHKKQLELSVAAGRPMTLDDMTVLKQVDIAQMHASVRAAVPCCLLKL